MSQKPDLSLYFLGASRAIRIAWLLEELGLDYKLISQPRDGRGLASPDFKKQIGTAMGKSPYIIDNGLGIQESCAITEYLCENYDPSSRMIPKERAARAKVREWMAACEGTFMLHALAILYARWRLPEKCKKDSSIIEEMEANLRPNVHNDLDWLEGELKKGGGKYLVGDSLTAADILMQFSIEFMFARGLGTQGKEWPNINKWMKGLAQESSYKKAVEKTGYSLQDLPSNGFDECSEC